MPVVGSAPTGVALMYTPTRSLVAPVAEPPTALAAADDLADPGAGRAADGAGRAVPSRGKWFRVGRNVIMLGVTSLITDISSEMVNSVLILYAAIFLGFGQLQLGIFDGSYQAVGSLVAVAAAVFADRRRRHKEVAAFGYGLSAICKLGLVAASGRWLPTAGILAADRLGKGVRSAPRDALISMSSARARLAESFGVHRSMDTIGLVIGPLIAAFILARNPLGFDTVFMTSFFVAIIGVAALVLFVDGHPHPADEPAPVLGPIDRPTADDTPTVSLRAAGRLLRDPRCRGIFLLGFVFALASPGDALIFVTFQHQGDLSLAFFPLMPTGTAIVWVLTAAPLGRLSDRVGRARVFIAGECLFVAVLVVLATGSGSLTTLVPMLCLLGVYYGATDGVLMAMASTVVPTELRASGLAVLTMTLALGHFVASAVFGGAWQWLGSQTATWLFIAAMGVALAVGVWMVRHYRLNELA